MYEYVRGVPLTHPLSDTVLMISYFSYMVPIYTAVTLSLRAWWMGLAVSGADE